MLLVICTTQVKKRVKKRFKERKKKKIRLRKIYFKEIRTRTLRGMQLELEVHASSHWTTSVIADPFGLKEVYIPSLWWLTVFKNDLFVFFFFFFNFLVELNLSLTAEARRKARNKPVNTLSGLVHANVSTPEGLSHFKNIRSTVEITSAPLNNKIWW